MIDIEMLEKWWGYVKCIWNHPKEIFACPKRLNDHEARLKALEADALALRQIGDVTIDEIDEALRLINDYQSFVGHFIKDKRAYLLARQKAYQYVKSLYLRVKSQKINPLPPNNLENINNFGASADECREYLLELRNTWQV